MGRNIQSVNTLRGGIYGELLKKQFQRMGNWLRGGGSERFAPPLDTGAVAPISTTLRATLAKHNDKNMTKKSLTEDNRGVNLEQIIRELKDISNFREFNSKFNKKIRKKCKKMIRDG